MRDAEPDDRPDAGPDAGPDDEQLEAWVADVLGRVEGGAAIDAAIGAVCGETSGHQPRLRARLEQLRQLGLVPGSTAIAPFAPHTSAPPATIGPYRIVRLLGRGGMGEVWLAHQTAPVERDVALKVTRSGLGSEHVLARFESERQAIARLNHDGIARVYDAGATDDGRPWFAMEHVDGVPITEFCDAQALGLDARLELFARVCDAVQHAHQHGVLHRDLKPTNVLVARQGEAAVAKVIDFGLAKAIDDREDAARLRLTTAGQVLGTPEYMSPEQADADGAGVDTRSDVYSLGVMLYELLTGCLPFSTEELRGHGLGAMQRVLRDSTPRLPSERSSDAAARRGLPSGTALQRRLRGDLDWIVRKTLEKAKADRYASVSELAADVRRHLRSEPVLAGPPSATYRLRKLVRRHRRAFAAAGVALLGLIAGLVLTLVQYLRAERHLADFDELALADRIARLGAEVDELWPAHPAVLPHFDSWLLRAREAVALLPARRQRLAALRATAGTQDGGVRHFAQFRDEVLHRELARLVEALDAFAAPGGAIAVVEARRAWAADLERRTLVAEQEAWSTACASIADRGECPKYAGLRIAPQLGLVPLGRDPHSGLWEFVLPQPGGEAPPRDARGVLDVQADSDLVLVLVPEGEVVLGEQAIALDAFFAGKHELTQGQWQRLTGGNPSQFHPGRRTPPVDLTHPVERVNHHDATKWLRRIGLLLPTEAQWVHAARGGGAKLYWSGDDPRTLAGDPARGTPPAANVADEAAARARVGEEGSEPGYDDGYPVHSPVDALRANPFGLHDVHGNLWEWCRDAWVELPTARFAPGDGGVDDDTVERVWRGGSFNTRFARATLEFRFAASPDAVNAGVGVRVCRAVER